MLYIDREMKVKFGDTLDLNRRFVILTHINPDGDAAGSALGLAGILKSMGKNVHVIFPSALPEYLHFLEGSEQSLNYETDQLKAEELIDDAQVVFCLDFNASHRAGGLEAKIDDFKGTVVMIDHHPNPNLNCELSMSDVDSSSTCELLFQIMKDTSYHIYMEKPQAEAILTGIVTDTGNLSYNTKSSKLYRTVAELLDMGADKDKIYEHTFHTFSEDRWRMLGYALHEKMVTIPELRTAYIALSQEDLQRFNFQEGDTEGIVNMPLMMKGYIFSAIFIEKEDLVKASFRSKGTFAVNDFSGAHFGGGGHVNAAGGKSTLNLGETAEYFESKIQEYRDQLKK